MKIRGLNKEKQYNYCSIIELVRVIKDV